MQFRVLLLHQEQEKKNLGGFGCGNQTDMFIFHFLKKIFGKVEKRAMNHDDFKAQLERGSF